MTGRLAKLVSNWEFEAGKRFQDKVLVSLNSPVHHPSSSTCGSFLLLAVFWRYTFRLTEETVSLALHACLGGTPAGFHVSYVQDRHFRFVLSCKQVGFMVCDLKRIITDSFDVYFHLWRDGGDSWVREERRCATTLPTSAADSPELSTFHTSAGADPELSEMANFPADPEHYIPLGMEEEDGGLGRRIRATVSLAGNPVKRHEEFMIATTEEILSPAQKLALMHDIRDYITIEARKQVLIDDPSEVPRSLKLKNGRFSDGVGHSWTVPVYIFLTLTSQIRCPAMKILFLRTMVIHILMLGQSFLENLNRLLNGRIIRCNSISITKMMHIMRNMMEILM
ncbi:hypothetical protein SETIT_4G239000v2 [Setaria italica]|uniref:DUF7597 domain-containing protein n=1 Tax=Setaria italica TaxID=4555 RepID=A0A368QXI8_SETIT|nr:hypothetical protein SETIT_4G239000v2 [Setaria italica]